jgi:hypothetical protein
MGGLSILVGGSVNQKLCLAIGKATAKIFFLSLKIFFCLTDFFLNVGNSDKP